MVPAFRRLGLGIVSWLAFLLTAGSSGLAAHAERPISYTHYPFDSGPPFTMLDMFLTWTEAPAEGAVFAATQFFFEDGQGGYIGLQVVGSTRTAIFSIWDIEAGSASPLAGCDRFGGEGEGARCLIEYPWLEGREYRLRVAHCDSDTSGETWCASLLDPTSGVEVTIGSIHLATRDRRAGYGRLARYSATFLEYFGGPDACDGHPFSDTQWRGPYGDGSVLARSADPDYTTCRNSEVSSVGRPSVRHENAGDTVRRTPAAVALWACSDGLDEDGDDELDFPEEEGCNRPGDYSERPDCMDGFDNDADGLVDFGADPDCGSGGSATEAPDRDRDGVVDTNDNCVAESNSDQRDSDRDDYGNACDADLDNDGVVNFSDLARLRAVFFSGDRHADLDGDGAVNFSDLARLKKSFFRTPGPSGRRP